MHAHAGAHNERERERSAKRPRSKLKFQVFLMVVELLNLDVRYTYMPTHGAGHTTSIFLSLSANEIDGGLPTLLQ